MEGADLPGSLCVCVCVCGCVWSLIGRHGVSECVPVDVWEGGDVSYCTEDMLHLRG